LMKSATFRMQ